MERAKLFGRPGLTAAGSLLAGSVLLGACSSEPSIVPNEPARIIEHEYAESYTYYVPTCFGYDSKGSCTVSVPMPYTEPEHYYLVLEQCEQETKCVTDSVDVTPETYDRLENGRTVIIDEEGNLRTQ